MNAKNLYNYIWKKCDEELIFISLLLLAFGQMRCQKLCIFYIPTFKTGHCTKHLMQWISVWWLLFLLTGLGPSVASWHSNILMQVTSTLRRKWRHGAEIRPGIILGSHKILSRVRPLRTPTSWAQQCIMETTLALQSLIC